MMGESSVDDDDLAESGAVRERRLSPNGRAVAHPIHCRIFTPAQPEYAAASVRNYCSGVLTFPYHNRSERMNCMQPGHGEALPVSFSQPKIRRFAEKLSVKFSCYGQANVTLNANKKSPADEVTGPRYPTKAILLAIVLAMCCDATIVVLAGSADKRGPTKTGRSGHPGRFCITALR
jgi:hypothetical protein